MQDASLCNKVFKILQDPTPNRTRTINKHRRPVSVSGVIGSESSFSFCPEMSASSDTGDLVFPPLSLKVRQGHTKAYKLQSFDRSRTVQEVIDWIIDKCNLDSSEEYALYSPSMANDRWLNPSDLLMYCGLNAKVRIEKKFLAFLLTFVIIAHRINQIYSQNNPLLSMEFFRKPGSI